MEFCDRKAHGEKNQSYPKPGQKRPRVRQVVAGPYRLASPTSRHNRHQPIVAEGLLAYITTPCYGRSIVLPEALLEEVARRFALLGDPTRLRLLRALHEDGELSVGKLAAVTGVARVNASQHLNRLALAGLVSRRREGTTVHCRVSDPSLDALCQLVCASVLERARALTGS